MKKLLAFYIVVGLIMCIDVEAQKSTESEAGFEKIFNGKNWVGWYLKLRDGDSTMALKVFVIEDGMVHVFRDTPDSLDLNTGANSTHGMFYNSKVYNMYIMRFEYKWGKKIANNFSNFQYDAGFYYHCYEDGIWPKGLEYQIRYDHTKNQNHTGDFWATNVQIDNWYADEAGKFLSESDGGKLQPIKKGEHAAAAKAPFNGLNNNWNQCEVIVMGDKYAIHKLNGMIVNIGTNLSKDRGLFGFQSETAEVFYRNIRVKELKKFIPMEEILANEHR